MQKCEHAGGIGLDGLPISVGGSPDDIPLCLQLVNAVLTDEKLESAVGEWKTAALRSLQSKLMLAEPQLIDAIAATVFGGDPRFVPLTPDIVRSQQGEAAQAWFRRIADHAAIEVPVVGKISADHAVRLVGKYLESLPVRAGKFTDLDSLRHVARGVGHTAERFKIMA